MNRAITMVLRAACLLALPLIVPGTVALRAQAPGIPAGWSDGYVYANGIRIHYYHAVPAPEKPAIVMLHGLTDIGLSWTTLTDKLQDAYDIYMLDARGHGLSDPFTTCDDGNTLVKDVVEFVRSIKLDKPILMGHSMGAATVMRLGAEYPDLPKAVIMLDPVLGARFGVSRTAAQTEATATPAGPQCTTARSATPSATTPPVPSEPNRLSVSGYGSPETLVAQNNYDFGDLVATCRRQAPKWAPLDCQYWALSKKQYHGAYSNEGWGAVIGTMRTAGALAKIAVPALILKADGTPYVRKTNEDAARVMQHGRLVHIDGAGHSLHHDQLARTVEVLKEFLATL